MFPCVKAKNLKVVLLWKFGKSLSPYPPLPPAKRRESKIFYIKIVHSKFPFRSQVWEESAIVGI